MTFEIAATLAAFFAGFAMKRGGLCTYAAALQIVEQRRIDRLLDFLGAAAWAALVVVPLAWWQPQWISLSGTHNQWLITLAGGALLGLGAWVNRGCVFGTFVQLVGGNPNYLATLLGMVLGVALAETTIANVSPAITEVSPAHQPGLPAVSWLAATAALSIVLLRSPVNKTVIMVILGAGGGLLFATLKGWDFSAVLATFTRHVLDPTHAGPAMLVICTTLAMIVGGLLAAFSNGSFKVQPWSAHTALACLMGGILMGMASYLIPGGNDGLLLKGIPGLAPHAFLGFAIMLVAMVVLLTIRMNNSGYRSPVKA